MKLIDPNIITFRGTVTDVELKMRLVQEALEQAGCLDAEGKRLKGVSVSIGRTGGRAGQGGWVVEITRDLRQSDQPRLPKPEGGNG